MTLAIDFNNTLHNQAEPIPGKRMGPPIEGAKQAMDKLCEAGHELIIHTDMAGTVRGRQVVADWLDYYKIPYGVITDRKPLGAAIFIDDKGYKFTGDWKKTLRDIIKLDGEHKPPA
jgi:hypothetical protein